MRQCGTTSASCRDATKCRELVASYLKVSIATLKANEMMREVVG